MLLLLVETFFFSSVSILVGYCFFYDFLKASFKSSMLIRFLSTRFAYVFACLFILVIIGSKLIFVFLMGSEIGSEYIAPAQLNQMGKGIKDRFDRIELPVEFLCGVRKLPECADEHKQQVSTATEFNWSFVTDTSDVLELGATDTESLENERRHIEQRVRWLSDSDFSANPSALFRGRVIHHYSTITHPYFAAFRDGYASIIAAQYGAISILPLFLKQQMSFQTYNALSFVIVIGIFGILFAKDFLRNPSALYGACVVGCLIAITLNQGAIYMSPGFNVLRYVPVACLVLISLFLTFGSFGTLLFACFGLLNSIHFNIMFILASGFLFLFERRLGGFAGERRVKFATDALGYRIFVLLIVVSLQLFMIQRENWNFPVSPFSSLNEGGSLRLTDRLIYGVMLVLFPIAGVILSFKKMDLVKVFRIVRAVIYTGSFASYAFSFPGSPQHFVGYLLLAAPAIILLLNTTYSNGRTYGFFLALVLIFPVYYYGLGTIPRPLVAAAGNIYINRNIGDSLSFKVATDAERILSDLRNLNEGKQLDEKATYFLIREKALLEIAERKAFYPSTYDAFANLRSIKPTDFLRYTDQFKVIVSYTPEYINQMRRYVGFASGNLLDPFEAQQHGALLVHHEAITEVLQGRERRCSVLYCIYKQNDKITK